MPEIQFLAHNNRVIVAPFEEHDFELTHRPRGWVGGFSKFSKKRLLDIFYSFEKCPFKTFWTFTFRPWRVPLVYFEITSAYAKKEINRMNMIFNRRGIGWLWCMEFTEKGGIHFHYALTGFLDVDWASRMWGNGLVWVSQVFGESGLRKYFVKEVAKGNQKSFHGFNGRWWGVSRHMNSHYSLGVYDESYALCLAGERGIKRNYWRKDLEGIVENPYFNFSNAKSVVKSSLIQKGKVQKNEKVTKRVGGVHVLVSDHGG